MAQVDCNITLAGNVVSPESGAVGRLLAAAIDAGTHIVVDVSGVGQIDSVFLRALVAADKGARSIDRRFVIRGVQGESARLLATTGLLPRLAPAQ